MTRIWVTIAGLLMIVSVSIGEIKFLKGPLSEAISRARDEKKPVMIDFITDWCMWCDTLDKNTYSDATVAAFVNSNVVPIKIDAEKGEGIEIARKYEVRAYPTILLIKADGEEIDRLVGYVPPRPFLKTVTDYVGGVNTIGQLKGELQKNPAAPNAQYALAAKYASRNDMKAAAEHYQKLLELDSNNTLGHNEEAEFTLAYSAMRAEKSTSKMAAFVEKYPRAPMARNAMTALVNASISLDDAEGAKKYFVRYTEQWAGDATMMNNYAWACAKKKMNLDHAAEVSRQSVNLAKNDNEKAMYLDTQATIEFERGNIPEAIRLEETALTLLKNATPKERTEYEETLAKFKAGKK